MEYFIVFLPLLASIISVFFGKKIGEKYFQYLVSTLVAKDLVRTGKRFSSVVDAKATPAVPHKSEGRRNYTSGVVFLGVQMKIESWCFPEGVALVSSRTQSRFSGVVHRRVFQSSQV